MIRAKMRLLKKTEHYNGVATFFFRPVKRTGKDGKQLDVENNTFWEYTPGGELEITVFAKEAPPFEVANGAYYFVDMEQKDDGQWVLEVIAQKSYGTEVELWIGMGNRERGPINSGSLKMNLSEKAQAAREAFTKHKSKWNIALTLAEPDDGSTTH